MTINYWHMQIHPDKKAFAEEHIYSLLEHNKIIGLGNWDGGKKNGTIDDFIQKMSVNDIVAIKNGSKLIALVQVIGGCYSVKDDESEIGWIKNRRPIRVLDWEMEEKTLPQPRGTLKQCVSDNAETTKIIKAWHKRVTDSFIKRKVHLTV